MEQNKKQIELEKIKQKLIKTVEELNEKPMKFEKYRGTNTTENFMQLDMLLSLLVEMMNGIKIEIKRLGISEDDLKPIFKIIGEIKVKEN